MGLGGTGGVRKGPFKGDLAVMFSFLLSSCFPIFVLSCNKKVLLFFSCFLSNAFRCWHQYHSLTIDVSSEVGAPWRCGVVSTQGGIAGNGWATYLGESMVQLARVEWKLLAC